MKPRHLPSRRVPWRLGFCAAWSLLVAPLAAADFTDLGEVLRTFADSRQTRDVKYHGVASDQQTFVDTLEGRVYRPTDQQVVRHVEALPEYQGKRVITHDFRTPGAEGVSVNTDRDVRVLVEVEPNRWIEVPARQWEDVYYREFARRTRYGGDLNDPLALREHAARYRQTPTDRFHMEASHDYSDQTRTLTYEPDGQGGFKRKMAPDSTIRVQDGGPGRARVEATPNVVRAKAGEGLLLNPESMAQMYFQKSWAELGAAQAIERQLQSPTLSAAERLRLNDLRQMHAAEGLAQMKKGVETLEAVRASYQRQGYRVGELPRNFQQASEIVKAVSGTSRTDVDAVVRQLQEHGFRSPTEFAENLRGQTEALKFAQKSAPPPAPSTRLQTAGRVAGWAGNVISIEQRLKEARQGSHLFWNFETGDSEITLAAKGALIAATELIPLPIIDALERGWRVDERARAYLEDSVRRGVTGWEVDPAFVLFAVVSTITVETVAAMTVDPLKAGGQMLVEGYRLGRDATHNFLADFGHAEQQRLLRESRLAAHERAAAFDLGGLYGRRGGFEGGPLVGDVQVGETIAFVVQADERWTDDYFVRWELSGPGGQSVVMVPERSAADLEAPRCGFVVAAGFAPGPHTLVIRVFERDGGRQVDFREATFTVSDQIGLGAITASLDHYLAEGGRPLFAADDARQVRPALPGDILAFAVARIGHWTEQHEVQWLVNGENYKVVPGADPHAHRLRFDSTSLAAGPYRIAARIIDTSSPTRKILGHQSVDLRLGPALRHPEPFALRATRRDFEGPALAGPAQNGDIIAVQADMNYPAGEPATVVLLWQVLDAAGHPLPGLVKREPIEVVDRTWNPRFRFQLESLPDGDYQVVLTHLLTNDPENPMRATFPFLVAQAVRIDRVLVTDHPEVQEHKPLLGPEAEALLYAYYSLGPTVHEATLTLSATNTITGQVIESVSAQRPRPGETAPYRMGLALPAAMVPVVADILFEAVIEAGEGQRHAARVTFKKEPFRVTLLLPNTLRSGETRPFTIQPPPGFSPPFKVELSGAGEGFSVGHAPGQLHGTVGAIATRERRTGYLAVLVTDAAGRTATAGASVVLLPGEIRPPAAASAPPSAAPYRPPPPSKVEAPPPRPAPAAPAPVDYEKIGRERWQRMATEILDKTIHPCFRTKAPRQYEQLRRILDDATVNFGEIGRMDAQRLRAHGVENEKKVAAAVYNMLMQVPADACAEQMVDRLAAHGLITGAQVNAFKEKNKPKTIYWVVMTSTLSRRGHDMVASHSARITTGSTPPATGFSHPNPSAPGHFLVATKAYGTLDQAEAQRIANDVNGQRGSAVFARTSYNAQGHIGAGHQGRPLLTLGRGVEALLGK